MYDIAACPIYKKTLENCLILKTLRNESIFLYSNRHNLQFFLPSGVFTSLVVTIYRFSLREPA